MITAENWGLTEKGFYRPTYVEILNALEYKARELFPDKVNLTVRSPIGIFLRIYAWMLNILFSVIEDVYNSRFIDTSVGTSLYNLGKSIGLQVLSAGKATGYVNITGKSRNNNTCRLSGLYPRRPAVFCYGQGKGGKLRESTGINPGPGKRSGV